MRRISRLIRCCAVSAAFMTLTGGIGCSSPAWSGMTMSDLQITSVHLYRSLELCTKDIQKTGGWCGKNCRDYGRNNIADCKPLVKIEKK
jgi:hypothetical protein